MRTAVHAAHHFWFRLILASIAAGAVTYGVTSFLTPKYESIGFLRIDHVTALAAGEIMRSPDVANKVLSGDAVAGETPESRMAFLSNNLKLTDPASPVDRAAGAKLSKISVIHPDPKRAQQIANALIGAWLMTTVPGAVEQTTIEEEIKRQKDMIDSTTKLSAKLQEGATSLLLPNSFSGEIATPISVLLTKRSEGIARLAVLERTLAGMSRDVIVAAPHLPEAPIGRSKAVLSALVALAVLPLGILLIVFHRIFSGIALQTTGRDTNETVGL